MKPIGPLMVEHRLIERIIPVLKKELEKIDRENEIDLELLGGVVDFFRTYADQVHHGKEENILFREMKKKEIDEADRQLMTELENDHKLARAAVGVLFTASQDYDKNGKDQQKEIKKSLETLILLYPPHIKKEDEIFFFKSMSYFSSEEQEAMFKEGEEFDRKIIHEKYKQAMENWEKK
jgi:hemerythrin-like domain-containing protein